MKKFLLMFVLISSIFISYAQETEARGYVPFVYGTYTAGRQVRIDFERDKKIDRIDFTWYDESEKNNSRVELYVDYMYKGSKSIYSSWGSFWVNDTPRTSVFLRVTSGKVRISRAYIYYGFSRDEINEEDIYMDHMISKGVNQNTAVELFNNMEDSEKMVALSYVCAKFDEEKEAEKVLENEYKTYARGNRESVNILDIKDEYLRKESAVKPGFYYNGEVVEINVEKGKKIKRFNVAWSKLPEHNSPINTGIPGVIIPPVNMPVKAEIFVDEKSVGYGWLQDTYYYKNFDVGFSCEDKAYIRILGGNIHISGVYVEYE